MRLYQFLLNNIQIFLVRYEEINCVHVIQTNLVLILQHINTYVKRSILQEKD